MMQHQQRYIITIRHLAKEIWLYLINLTWLRDFLAWALRAAGVAAEAVFVLCPLWISLQAAVRPLLLWFMPEETVKLITWLADMALIAIPELLLLQALIIVFERLQQWRTVQFRFLSIECAWFLAYTLPTSLLLIITILTIWSSFNNAAFELPSWAIQLRGMIAYIYGIISLLSVSLRRPHGVAAIHTQADQPSIVEQLHAELARLQAITEERQQYFDQRMRSLEQQIMQILPGDNPRFAPGQNTVLTPSKPAGKTSFDERQNEGQNTGQNTVLTPSKPALKIVFADGQNEGQKAKNNGVPYQEEAIPLLAVYPGMARWLNQKALTTDAKEIKEILGLSSKQIAKCLETGMFKRAPRNQERIIISSVVSWLQSQKGKPTQRREKNNVTGAVEPETEHLAVVASHTQ